MPDPDSTAQIGPIRWIQLAHATGMAAEAAAGAWLTRQLDVDAAPLAIRRDEHGRPRLAHGGGYDISWSHSGEHLLVAAGRGVELGADLERLRPRPRALELADRFFAPAESRWLQAQSAADRDLAFVRLWCAKEAVLKAHGRGIAFGLHRFRVGEHAGAMRLLEADPALGAVEDWSLHEFEPSPGYRAALAWRVLR